MLTVLVLLVALEAPAIAAPLHEQEFRVPATAEVVAVVTASCAECDWGRHGHEAAALELIVDDRPARYLFLIRGSESAEYRVALGRLSAGSHRLVVRLDRTRSAEKARTATVARAVIEPAAPGSEAERRLAYAPILMARPNTVGRFSDVPLVMWTETETTPRGTWIRYSVVFSNEDGGTPPDRLMATWGRLTDIEYVYGVELDAGGRVLAEEFQGPEHKLTPFQGAREAAQPLMYVVTDNNMVSDHGEATLRFALAPFPFDLSGVSREAVMDANPWTYAVSVREARREKRIDEKARPGAKKLPDPRRFATLEACAATADATITFSIGVRAASGPDRWFDSAGGLPGFRIGRQATEFPNGCFRGAVALPPGTSADDVVGLRFRAFTRRTRQSEPPLAKGAGSARLQRVNTVFLLGANDEPGASLFSWRGDSALEPEGPALEIPFQRAR